MLVKLLRQGTTTKAFEGAASHQVSTGQKGKGRPFPQEAHRHSRPGRDSRPPGFGWTATGSFLFPCGKQESQREK